MGRMIPPALIQVPGYVSCCRCGKIWHGKRALRKYRHHWIRNHVKPPIPWWRKILGVIADLEGYGGDK